MNEFIEQIIKNLNSNGFPAKRVSLPTEKMYEIADNKGLSFNKVMDSLKELHQIESVVDGEKIIFSKIETTSSSDNPFAGMDQEDMMKKAQEMMAQMDPAELERMKSMFMNMSEEEKEDIMQKGKDLGLL